MESSYQDILYMFTDSECTYLFRYICAHDLLYSSVNSNSEARSMTPYFLYVTL